MNKIFNVTMIIVGVLYALTTILSFLTFSIFTGLVSGVLAFSMIYHGLKTWKFKKANLYATTDDDSLDAGLVEGKKRLMLDPMGSWAAGTGVVVLLGSVWGVIQLIAMIGQLDTSGAGLWITVMVILISLPFLVGPIIVVSKNFSLNNTINERLQKIDAQRRMAKKKAKQAKQAQAKSEVRI